MRWSGEVVPWLELSLSGTAQAGRLVCVSISGLRQGCGGLRIGLPRECELVEVHVRSGDDLVDGGHPDVVGSGESQLRPRFTPTQARESIRALE
eukprot:2204308-Pleurochrysis_carterae.AAC.1